MMKYLNSILIRCLKFKKCLYAKTNRMKSFLQLSAIPGLKWTSLHYCITKNHKCIHVHVIYLNIFCYLTVSQDCQMQMYISSPSLCLYASIWISLSLYIYISNHCKRAYDWVRFVQNSSADTHGIWCKGLPYGGR